jgi:FKBP-type peptidyl-prolyl cis-trans isomerase
MRNILIRSSLILSGSILTLLLPLAIDSQAAIVVENNSELQPRSNAIAKAIGKKLKTVTTASGLKYTILKTGKGAIPKQGQTVSVHYTGTLTNGKKFDSSLDRGQPFAFILGKGQVIAGWDEALSTMKVGERRKLTIPPQLGYGAAGAGGVIPPNAMLIFDVELLKISN